jgi:protein transport protein SEC61 subunit alpha
MELGISPLITSSMILQFMVGAKLIQVDMRVKEDKDLFNQAQKCKSCLCSLGHPNHFWRSSGVCDVRHVRRSFDNRFLELRDDYHIVSWSGHYCVVA